MIYLVCKVESIGKASASKQGLFLGYKPEIRSGEKWGTVVRLLLIRQ